MKTGDWRDRAACVGMDTELFFLNPTQPPKEVIVACHYCPVKEQCREYNDEWEGQDGDSVVYGYWAGETAEQRRARRKDTATDRRALSRRKAHCRRGHAVTAENTYEYRTARGYAARKCRVCQRESTARIRAKRGRKRK